MHTAKCSNPLMPGGKKGHWYLNNDLLLRQGIKWLIIKNVNIKNPI